MNSSLLLILTILVGIVLIWLLLYVFISFQRAKFLHKQKIIVIQVRVSKENESGPIVAEQIFSTLHGLQTEFSFFQKLKGYTGSSISFEIASVNRIIKFYVAFPQRLRNLVEGQIYAQYPDVEIEDCEDYSSKRELMDRAIGVDLKLNSCNIFPIKRYSQFEDKINRLTIDPLAGITSSILKFNNPEDQAWIQIIVTPLKGKWRHIFTKCAKILDKGIFGNITFLTGRYANAFTTRKIWPKIVFFPVYFIFWIQGLKVQAGVELGEAKSSSSSLDPEELTSMTHDRESITDAALDKVVRLLFDVNIRIVYLPKEKSLESSTVKLREIVGSFKQFNLPHLNGFEMKNVIQGESIYKKYHNRSLEDGFVLNNEELATIYHLPNITVQTPSIYWVESKKVSPPINLPTPEDPEGDKLTTLGKTNYRGQQQVFGIQPIDRARHAYIIGKTGMGKSTLLENMIFSDIIAGKGVGVIDPHGDLAEAVLNFVPSNRTNDVILIDPSDREYAVAFNMLENVDPALNSIVCSGLVGIFKKIYAHSWGPRLEHILRNTILALLEYPGTTMLGITRILQDYEYRNKIIKKIQDPVVKSFWYEEFNKMPEKTRVEAVSPIQNKVGQFLSSPIIRNVVGQVKSTVDIRFAMDKGKIVIINLSKGKIGEDNSALLGAMFITKFQLDAMSRANIPEKDRKNFYLYVDEFQNFATESFATILSEARKYKLNLTMANQYIAQMEDEVRDAVFGNVGSILSFQVGFDDAEYLSLQFGEQVLPSDLVSLSKYNAYMKLLVDGMPTKTFSLVTLPPPEFEIDPNRVDKVKKVTRERYANKTTVIEDKIKRWSSTKQKEKIDDDSNDKTSKVKNNKQSKGNPNK
ncbi:type IV secretory system conjugative DNA transfer family protein [Patescibacteria group bacterium]